MDDKLNELQDWIAENYNRLIEIQYSLKEQEGVEDLILEGELHSLESVMEKIDELKMGENNEE